MPAEVPAYFCLPTVLFMCVGIPEIETVNLKKFLKCRVASWNVSCQHFFVSSTSLFIFGFRNIPRRRRTVWVWSSRSGNLTVPQARTLDSRTHLYNTKDHHKKHQKTFPRRLNVWDGHMSHFCLVFETSGHICRFVCLFFVCVICCLLIFRRAFFLDVKYWF